MPLGARCGTCSSRQAIGLRNFSRQQDLRLAAVPRSRPFTTGAGAGGKRPKFSPHGLHSKIQWYPIPVGLGIGFLGLMQFYKVSTREKEKQRQLEEGLADGTASPKKRPRVRLEGPW